MIKLNLDFIHLLCDRLVKSLKEIQGKSFKTKYGFTTKINFIFKLGLKKEMKLI